MKTIAIIPARGGSKRIPLKNIKPFFGLPIIAYSIQAACDSRLFDEVMVSTDDTEIADVARSYGAVVPFMRSERTSGDMVNIADVIIEVIQQYEKTEYYFSNICCISATAPFVTVEKLQVAYTKWQESQSDALIPVVKFSFPPYRGCVIQNEQLKMRWPEYTNSRSQDFDSLYHDAGQFYYIKKETLLNERTLWCKRITPLVLAENEVQDIDSIEDWELAELKYKLLNKL